MSRVRDFSDQQRASGVGQIAAHAHDETAREEHGIGITGRRAGLNGGSENDCGAPNCCTQATAKDIGNVGRDKEDSKASKSRERAQ